MLNFKDFENCRTFESAFIVESYPYGFKRTKKAYWVERKGNKERLAERTLNPSTQKWNNIKYSTYSDLILLFKQEETGFIKSYHYNLQFSDIENLNKLLESLGDYRTDYIENLIKLSRAVFETRKSINVVLKVRQFRHKITGEITENIPIFDMANYEEIGEEEERENKKATTKAIGQLFLTNAIKEGLNIEDLNNL